MKKFKELMQAYENSHTKYTTKVTHYIGIPCILFAVQMSLGTFKINLFAYAIPLAWVSASALFIYYLLLDIPLALMAACFYFPLTAFAILVAQSMPPKISLLFAATCFAFGWCAQFLGHYFEGNRPAFLSNLRQIFIAPIFLISEVWKKV